MKIAYADPPYLGRCGIYGHHHPDGLCWDDVETHRRLIARLMEFDGWAVSLGADNLRAYLSMVDDDVRIMAWCKTSVQIRPIIRSGHGSQSW